MEEWCKRGIQSVNTVCYNKYRLLIVDIVVTL